MIAIAITLVGLAFALVAWDIGRRFVVASACAELEKRVAVLESLDLSERIAGVENEQKAVRTKVENLRTPNRKWGA